MNDRDELTSLEDRLGGALRRSLAVVLDPLAGPAPTPTPDAAGDTPSDGIWGGGMRDEDAPVTARVPIDPEMEAAGEPGDPSRRRRAAAAAVVVLLGAGAFAWSGSRDPGVRPAQTGTDESVADDTVADETGSDPSDPNGTGASSVTSLPTPSSIVAVPATTPVPADLDGLVWVPAVEPAGFRLTSVSVVRPTRVFDRPATRYLRRGADGSTVTAWVELVATLPRPDDEAEGTGTDGDTATDGPTVHGQPADVFETNPGEWHVTWRESGLVLRVRAGGRDRATVLQLAESSVVDVREPALRFRAAPDGFEGVNVADLPDDAPTTSYSWLPEDSRPGMFVTVVARPNTGRHTLDTLLATSSADGWEHTRIWLDRGNADPLLAWVATSPVNEFGRLTTITWIEGPYVLSVDGRVGLDQLREVAGGLVAASLPDARALRTRVDAEALELPELDRTTTPSAVIVSVRTTGTGANVVCVEAPFTRCRYTSSESSLVGDEQTAVVETFTVDGARWVVGWAQGDHMPRMVVDGVSQPLADVGVGSAGTFFVVRDPVADASFVFDEDDLETGPVFGSAVSLDEDLLG